MISIPKLIQRLNRTVIAEIANADERSRIANEELRLLIGKQLALEVKNLSLIDDLGDAEFRVFSQFGDDGIIQYLISKVVIENKLFVEFGVENYREANTRFLLQNDNWAGLIIDSSLSNISSIRNEWYYWRHSLKAMCEFVTRDNINKILFNELGTPKIGLLHIDIDGNDYWVWDAIDVIEPVIVVIEYNSLFGRERAITIPYEEQFDRFNAHSSGLYFGASLMALNSLGRKKGYGFIGCNTAGNNAYFIHRDFLGGVSERDVSDGYVESLFRQHRDVEGNLTLKSNRESIEEIRGMRVFNVQSNQEEEF